MLFDLQDSLAAVERGPQVLDGSLRKEVRHYGIACCDATWPNPIGSRPRRPETGVSLVEASLVDDQGEALKVSQGFRSISSGYWIRR